MALTRRRSASWLWVRPRFLRRARNCTPSAPVGGLVAEEPMSRKMEEDGRAGQRVASQAISCDYHMQDRQRFSLVVRSCTPGRFAGWLVQAVRVGQQGQLADAVRARVRTCPASSSTFRLMKPADTRDPRHGHCVVDCHAGLPSPHGRSRIHPSRRQRALHRAVPAQSAVTVERSSRRAVQRVLRLAGRRAVS